MFQHIILEACKLHPHQKPVPGVATYDIFRESPVTSLDDAVPNKAIGKELGTKEVSKVFIQRGLLPAFASLSSFFPSLVEDLQKMAVLSDLSHWPLKSISSMETFQRLSFLWATPTAAFALDAERRYVHTLFALKERNLSMIQANSAEVAYSLVTTAQEHRRHLVQDLRNGHSEQ